MTENPNKSQLIQSPQPLPPEAMEIISKLPNNQRQVVLRSLKVVQTTLHAGPLPHPDILAAYNVAVPGAAERIIAMAEEQSRHRISIENQVIPQREVNSARGQHYALIIGLSAIVAAVICAYLKQPIVGSVVVGTPLCGLGYAFLTGKQKQERELTQKKPQ